MSTRAAQAATVIGSSDSATKAIADIAAVRPDAVTIDIGLKNGSGFDVLEAIASERVRPPLRIVLTNYVTDAYREAARCLGAEYFFDKARQMRDLVNVLMSYKESRTVTALRVDAQSDDTARSWSCWTTVPISHALVTTSRCMRIF